MYTVEQKLRSLYLCRNHWQWMQITGSEFKSSYFPANVWEHECACCDLVYAYNNGLGSPDCCECPLNDFAWTQRLFKYACDNSDDSPYWLWKVARYSIPNRKYYAGRMVWACNKAIEYYLMQLHD